MTTAPTAQPATAPTENALVVVVSGINPAPQGSKAYKGHRYSQKAGRKVPVLAEDSARVKPWRDAVALFARQAAARAGLREPLDMPLKAEIVFTLERPASVKNRPYPHRHGSGDVDKLLRATLDALDTDANVIADDSRVCDVHMNKRYAGTPGALTTPGAVIRLTPLPT